MEHHPGPISDEELERLKIRIHRQILLLIKLQEKHTEITGQPYIIGGPR